MITWLVVTAVSAVAIIVVGRHVLTRPQPVTKADVVAADEARRVASLRVLAAAAIAIGGYLVVGVAGLPLDPVRLWETWQPLVTTLTAVLLPVLAAVAALVPRPAAARRVASTE